MPEEEKMVKRGRGRPRKHPSPVQDATAPPEIERDTAADAEPDALSLLPLSPVELALNHFGLAVEDLNPLLPGGAEPGYRVLSGGRIRLYTRERGTLIWNPAASECAIQA